MMKNTTLKSKVWLTLVFGLVVGTVFRRLSIKYFSPWISPTILLGISITILLFGIIAPYIWYFSKKQNANKSLQFKALLEHGIIYALAIDLYMFGWHKIEGLQMIVPLGLLDTPFSEFPGENLVWAFFRYSYSFMVFLAVLQILSSMLLLFARTRLSGLLIALVLLVFISSLDFFYHMPIGIRVHSLILLLGISYFLIQQAKVLLPVILKPIENISPLQLSKWTKNFFKISIIICPLIFWSIYSYPDKHPQFTGKYEVKDLIIDGQAMMVTSPKDSVLSMVYMDLDDEIVFHFNDYRYRYIGQYEFDEIKDSISIRWRYPSQELPVFKGRLIKNEDGILLLNGEMDNERIEMSLIKKSK